MKNDTQPAAAETVDFRPHSDRWRRPPSARADAAGGGGRFGPHPCRWRCPPGLNRTLRAAPQFGGAAVPEPALEPANNRRIGNQMRAEPCASFYRMIDEARMPQRADRSAVGTLPTRATRYCEAVTSASAIGWWLFPPIDVSLVWDGADISGTTRVYRTGCRWKPAIPNFAKRFDNAAPEYAQGCAPPFLTALPEPGAFQIWTGLFARSAPGWSLLVRAPANLPHPGGYVVYEGILETDQWFGPLFANIRLTRTGTPVRLRTEQPIIQAQPLPREIYADETLNSTVSVPNLEAWQPEDWADYNRDVIQPNSVPKHVPGRYATAVRRRRKSGCPYANSSPSAQAA